ncbi:antibiotic biosynthesis monooxygenase [Haloechinothrix salitolerans]
MYTVIANYRAAPGRGEDVAVALKPHIRATRDEPGCVGFTVNRSIEDPDVFALYEEYLDKAAFKSHVDSAHYQKYVIGEVRPLLRERSVSFYRTVEP